MLGIQKAFERLEQVVERHRAARREAAGGGGHPAGAPAAPPPAPGADAFVAEGPGVVSGALPLAPAAIPLR